MRTEEIEAIGIGEKDFKDKQNHTKGGKMTKKTEWNKRVMRIYHERKKSNPKYTLKDAMKEAKRGW